MPCGTYMAREIPRKVQMMLKFFQRITTQYLILIVHIQKKIQKLKRFFLWH